MGMRCIIYIQILEYVSGGGSNYVANTSVTPLTSLLNALPTNISSAVFPAYTPESTK
jgi:hypothetical protein